jgi:hypothetical protein
LLVDWPFAHGNKANVRDLPQPSSFVILGRSDVKRSEDTGIHAMTLAEGCNGAKILHRSQRVEVTACLRRVASPLAPPWNDDREGLSGQSPTSNVLETVHGAPWASRFWLAGGHRLPQKGGVYLPSA